GRSVKDARPARARYRFTVASHPPALDASHVPDPLPQPSLQVPKASRQVRLAAARLTFAACTHCRRSAGVDRSRQAFRAVEKPAVASPRHVCFASLQAARHGFTARTVPATRGTRASPIASGEAVPRIIPIPVLPRRASRRGYARRARLSNHAQGRGALTARWGAST